MEICAGQFWPVHRIRALYNCIVVMCEEKVKWIVLRRSKYVLIRYLKRCHHLFQMDCMVWCLMGLWAVSTLGTVSTSRAS